MSFQHPKLTDHSLDVFDLQDQVSLNEKIQLIQLPSEDITCPLGKQFIASGWGKDRFQNKDIPFTNISFTRFLQAVYMDCLDINECPFFGNDDSSLVFCVGDSLKRQNAACSGDSGGKFLDIFWIKEYLSG